MTLVFDPSLPGWALALVAAACLLVAIVSIVRNWRSGAFRAIALAALVALLANPLIREAERTGLDDIALVLVDKSASQNLGGRDAAADRTAKALMERLERLDNVEARLIEFTGEEKTLTLESIQNALADTPRARIGAVFVVTDGQAADAAQKLAGLEAPLHLIVAGAKNEIDRKITLTNAPRYGIVDQSVRVSFRVDDFVANEEIVNEGQPVEVILRVDGEEILSEPVPLGSEAGFDAPLTRPGATIIELEVAGRDGELTTRNNIAVLPITAIRDRLRVLLISGEPHPGERVWRNLLKSDPAVDLVHFTILRPIDNTDNTPVSELALIQFPQDELFIEKLTEFDLLIFDRYTYRAVLDSFHFDNIARYVEQGGAVLIAAGPEYAGRRSLAARRNLAFILPAVPAGPAVEGAFRPEITDLGSRHPVTAGLGEEDFWGRWFRIMPVDRRRGQTLMAGPDDSPLLVLDRFKEGRVGLLLSDHVWLWARGFDGGGPHAELLRRIAHWLMKEPELEEEALSLFEEDGALVVRRRTVKSQTEPVSVELPDGESRSLELSRKGRPGIFEARIDDAPRGLYRARIDQLFAIGSVGLAAAPEFNEVVSTERKLKPLAKETGGGVFRVDQGGGAPELKRVNDSALRHGDGWAGVIKRGAARVDAVRDAPAAPGVFWLILIAAALLSAWLIESGRMRGEHKETINQI